MVVVWGEKRPSLSPVKRCLCRDDVGVPVLVNLCLPLRINEDEVLNMHSRSLNAADETLRKAGRERNVSGLLRHSCPQSSSVSLLLEVRK